MFLSTLLFLTGAVMYAPADTLAASAVTADRGVTVSRTDTVSFDRPCAGRSTGDVLLLTPGLLMSDYGGYAGLKTVSLRGLGSAHTTVMVDGIKLGNVQSGQNDLGMLGMEDFSGAVIDYAQNSLDFTTRRPTFDGRSFAGDAAIYGGSFGTWMPHVRMDFNLPAGMAISAHASGTVSDGDFPFGEGQVRANNDIRQLRSGVDIFGTAGRGDWMVKTYFNGSDRGTPGSSDWPSSDRQTDRNMFVQGVLRLPVNARNRLNVSAKASSDKLLYKSEWGDSDGTQTELQLNVADRFKAGRNLELSASAGAARDVLNSTYYEASRTSVTGIAGASYKYGGFRADAALQYDGVFDSGSAVGAELSHNSICPSLDLRQTVCKGLELTGFARRAYRVPTFNELYYPGYGNPELDAEDAWLFDLGLDWSLRTGGPVAVRTKVDAFMNSLHDKITSAPTPENPSIWMPYNIGEVLAKGLDADVRMDYVSGGWSCSLCARYTYQYADNVPYLSRHSAVVTADASYSGWSLDAVWNLRAGRRDSYGDMPDWNALDLTAAKCFRVRGIGSLTLSATCRNVTDERYSLVSGYPMPGRSVLAGMSVKF